jgi:disulfide bond formation protein DsbB
LGFVLDIGMSCNMSGVHWAEPYGMLGTCESVRHECECSECWSRVWGQTLSEPPASCDEVVSGLSLSRTLECGAIRVVCVSLVC